MVRCTSESPLPDLPLAPPMESISSMKIMVGAASLAMTNNSRTIRAPSPMYFCTNSAPLTRINVQSVWWATARANSVLPVPGGPYIKTPFGCEIPNDSNNSGCLMGSSMTSLISRICFSRPPHMSYVESGTFSNFMRDTKGSTLVGSIRCSWYDPSLRATRVFIVHFSMSMSLAMSTTYLPSGPTFTNTFLRDMTLMTSPM